MNTPTYKSIFLFALLVLVAGDACYAASGPGAMMQIAYHREIVQSYGHVSLILAIGVLYLQIRRCGFTKQTVGWMGLFIFLYFINPGWHNSRFGGESGEREVKAAQNATLLIGLLLVAQVFASLRSIWVHRSKPSAFQSEAS